MNEKTRQKKITLEKINVLSYLPSPHTEVSTERFKKFLLSMNGSDLGKDAKFIKVNNLKTFEEASKLNYYKTKLLLKDGKTPFKSVVNSNTNTKLYFFFILYIDN